MNLSIILSTSIQVKRFHLWGNRKVIRTVDTLYPSTPEQLALTALKLKNPHNRDARITFEPVAHKYFVDGGTNPDAFRAVTTWVHSHFEVFNADAVIDKMMASKSWDFNEKYRGKSKDHIKAEWDLNRDRAAAAGTDMHAAIELYCNNNARAADDAERIVPLFMKQMGVFRLLGRNLVYDDVTEIAKIHEETRGLHHHPAVDAAPLPWRRSHFNVLSQPCTCSCCGRRSILPRTQPRARLWDGFIPNTPTTKR
jgi:hypothetical protein